MSRIERLVDATKSILLAAACIVAYVVTLTVVIESILSVGDVEVSASLDAASTNEATTTTTWPVETIGTLPAGFDPQRLTTTTTTTPKAVTTVRGAAVDIDTATLERIIRDGFDRFGADVAEQAVNVAHCEAPHDDIPGALDPNATGDAGEVGLFQIHPSYHAGRAAKFGWSMADLYDPTKNVAVAVDLYAERGWVPWSCRGAA